MEVFVAQERLKASWEDLPAELEILLEVPRSWLAEAEATLEKELRAAGKAPGTSTDE